MSVLARERGNDGREDRVPAHMLFRYMECRNRGVAQKIEYPSGEVVALEGPFCSCPATPDKDIETDCTWLNLKYDKKPPSSLELANSPTVKSAGARSPSGCESARIAENPTPT